MSFVADIGKFSDKAMGRVAHVVKTASEEMVNSIIDDTPRVTGWTQGNWQTSVGTPKTDVLPLRPVEAAKAEVSAAGEFARGADVKLFVRNNCPHIKALEYDGLSDQAPNGMVRKNVARWGRIVREKAQQAKSGS